MPFVKNAVRYYFIVTLTFIATLSSTQALADENDTTLLNTFHENGITKCDSFVLEHGKLEGDWRIVTTSHPGLNTKNFTELGLTQVTGSEGDTVMKTHSFIQTSTACYVLNISTVTNSGRCSDSIDLNYWYVKDAMKGLDYKKYENKGGVVIFAKDISVGNFNACIKEYHQRTQQKIKS